MSGTDERGLATLTGMGWAMTGVLRSGLADTDGWGWARRADARHGMARLTWRDWGGVGGDWPGVSWLTRLGQTRTLGAAHGEAVMDTSGLTRSDAADEDGL